MLGGAGCTPPSLLRPLNIYTANAVAKSLGYYSGVKQNDGKRCFMMLCEVTLGKIKEIGLNNDDDTTEQLNLEKFQSRQGVDRNIPDPR